MKFLYAKFLLPLKTGTRVLILILGLMYAAAFVGVTTNAYNVFEWLGLRSTSVWQGEAWRVLSYAFVSPNLVNLLLNVIVIAMLGAFLERIWSAKEFALFCLISAAGAGIAKALLSPSDSSLVVTSVPIIFGLLIAWAKIFGHERIYFMGIWEMSVRAAAIFFAAVSIFTMLPCAGLVNTLIMLCGGVSGWLYLFFRLRSVRLQQSQVVSSVRMGRLEL